MEAVINIIKSLGVNDTIWVQLGLFLVVFFALKTLVFKPFFEAHEGRHNATQGNEEAAEKIFTQTRELESLYQRKARSMNADVKAIFDKARLEANLEYEKIIGEAKEKARLTLDKHRNHIQEEFNKAREDLIKEGPLLGVAIADKLLAEEVR